MLGCHAQYRGRELQPTEGAAGNLGRFTAYVDDIDGTDLGGEGNTLFFAFDGKEYSIDLSDENTDTFRQVITPYIEAGQRVTGNKKTRARPRPRPRPGTPRQFVIGLAPMATTSLTSAAFPPQSYPRTQLPTSSTAPARTIAHRWPECRAHRMAGAPASSATRLGWIILSESKR